MLGDLAGAAEDAAAAKTVEEPTAELKAIAKQVQSLVQPARWIARGRRRTEVAVDGSFVRNTCTSPAESPDKVVDVARRIGAAGPAYGLRAVTGRRSRPADQGAAGRREGGSTCPEGLSAATWPAAASSSSAATAARWPISERPSNSASAAMRRRCMLTPRPWPAPASEDEAVAAQREAVKLRPDVAEYREQLAEFVAKK